MIIFPAIDIQNGNVVRLLQGKFDQVTEYGQDPLAMARHWEGQGSEWLHVIDLKKENEELKKELEKLKQ